MRVTAIEFDESGDPESVTARMSLQEAAFIARLAGSVSTQSVVDVLGLDGTVIDGIYSALVPNVFNAFYEDGLNEIIPRATVALGRRS